MFPILLMYLIMSTKNVIAGPSRDIQEKLYYKIWSGLIEWKRHDKTHVPAFSCDILAAVSALPNIKGDTWPNSLQLHLIPKETYLSAGKGMAMHTVWFIIEPCVARTELTKALQQGLVATVKFNPSPGCDIKMLMLLYEHPNKYFGFIPHEQDKYISELHSEIQNKIQQILKLKVTAKPLRARPIKPVEVTKVWEGVVQWIRYDRAPVINVSPLTCIIRARTSSLSELRIDTWPVSMKLYLMPRKAVEIMIGGWFFRASVVFFFKPSIEIEEISNAMERGMIGCVRFDPSPGCDIKVIVLLYLRCIRRFLGLVPT